MLATTGSVSHHRPVTPQQADITDLLRRGVEQTPDAEAVRFGGQATSWRRLDDRARRGAAALAEGGWLRSGDAGHLDGDGYLFVTDRVKDMIISGGENIYPAEIERVLAEHSAVADLAVIGVPDDRWGEVPLAIVVAATGAEVDEAELLAYCRQRLASFKCPRGVAVAEELPRNPTGKILKKDLRAPYWEGRSRRL